MIEKKEFYNVRCDCCGQLLDEETWWDNDILDVMLKEANWRKLGDKHCCDSCWEYDDDDNIVTKDGRKYTEDGEEITTITNK